MNEFKINVFFNEEEKTIESTMIKVFNEYIKAYINNLENSINESYTLLDKKESFVKKEMEEVC